MKRYGLGNAQTIKFQYKHENIVMSDYYSKNADLESAEKLIKESYVLSKLKTEKRKVILERRGEKVGDK